jgi:NADH-quinone oxidoreductase subunit L
MDGNIIFWGMGVSAALLTAFYMFRLVFMTFHGESRVDPSVHPHESPKVMTMPLVALAGLATVGGLLGIPLVHGWHILHEWLAPVLHFDLASALQHSEHMLHQAGEHAPSWAHLLEPKEHNLWIESLLMLFSAAVAVVGIFGAYMFYIKRPDLPEKFTQGQWGFDLVQNKYYIDELYDDSIVKPTVEGSKMLWKECDAKAIDGSVNGAAKIIGWLSRNAQAFQSGFVRNYALFMVVGFISLLLVMF